MKNILNSFSTKNKITKVVAGLLLTATIASGASKNNEQISSETEINLGTLTYQIIREEAERILVFANPLNYAQSHYKKDDQSKQLWKNLGGYNGLIARYEIMNLLKKGTWPFELTNNIQVPQGFYYNTGDSTAPFYKQELVGTLGKFDFYMSRMNQTSCYISNVATKVSKKFSDGVPDEYEVTKTIHEVVAKDLEEFLYSQKRLTADKFYVSFEPVRDCRVLSETPITLSNSGTSDGSSWSQGGAGYSSGTSSSSTLQFFGFVGQKVMCENGGMDYKGNDMSIYLNNCHAKIGDGVKIGCDTGTLIDTNQQVYCNRKIVMKVNNSGNREYLNAF